jgi:trimethylamine--corrinoid protein Co-methyltransferase
MRPVVRFLNDELVEQIICEAVDILCSLGFTIHNEEALGLLSDHGASVDKDTCHVCFTKDIVEQALKTSPSSFRLYDVLGNQTHDFSGYNVHYNPGSSAINVLDYESGQCRKPTTQDYIEHAKLVSQLEYIDAESTALIPTDICDEIYDSYRLFLSLLYCEKPVVTGAFTIESFNIMKEFQLAVRGNEKALKEKPLTIFSCCPTSPLKWAKATSQNLIDCARHFIPVEIITMPLSGFTAPVTLVGTLIQHTAEILSGVVICQLTQPGAPMLYGGSPAVFDVRYETTPMGAIETMMMDCAFNEIGKYLKIPTQAYTSMSDAKYVDAQAGLESGMGATLAALAGINNISGPGMIDFENCQSLEKLVLDNEMCGMTRRLIKGIEPKDDFPSEGLFRELLREKHLLISDHTRRYLAEEFYVPGSVIERANRGRWALDGGLSLGQRAHSEVKRLLKSFKPSSLPEDVTKELVRLMEAEAKRFGQDKLPQRS